MSKYIDKDKVLEYIIFGVVGKDITCGELKRGIESLPTIEVSNNAISPVEPGRPKGTETMMVDGEPMEIDPLSYEVGYTHGQKERTKKLYIPLDEYTVERVNRLHKDECGEYFDEEWLYNELEQLAVLI